MVWRASGVEDLVNIDGIMKTDKNSQILICHAVTCLRHLIGKGFIYQHHTTTAVKAYVYRNTQSGHYQSWAGLLRQSIKALHKKQSFYFQTQQNCTSQVFSLYAVFPHVLARFNNSPTRFTMSDSRLLFILIMKFSLATEYFVLKKKRKKESTFQVSLDRSTPVYDSNLPLYFKPLACPCTVI